MGIGEKEKTELDRTLKELNLSNEECDKFAKAFKDPEFMKLFEEYAKEVSDPKVKAETDLYLRQLEAEGRGEEVYGKGTLLVLPKEAYVIKTQVEGTGQKVFINVCTSDKVDKLSMEPVKGPGGKVGRNVQIPLTLSSKKTGKDKAGQPCLVWDFVVHPDTVEAAAARPAIRKLLAETAIEHIESAHQVKCSKQYKEPKMKYKGADGAPKPHVLGVRTNAAAAGGDSSGRLKPVNPAGAFPEVAESQKQKEQELQLQAQGQGQEGNSAGAGARSAFKFPAAKQQAQKKEDKPKDPSTPGFMHPGGEVTPQWELVHRGQVDLAACWGDMGRSLSSHTLTYPEALVLRIQLPGVASAGGVDLDVSRQALGLKVPGQFKLDVSLPYAVKDTEGRAKFDKVKQQLEVTLPTVPPPRPSAADAALGSQEASPLVSEVDDTPTGAVTPESTSGAVEGHSTTTASAAQQASSIQGGQEEAAGASQAGSSQEGSSQACQLEFPQQGDQQSIAAGTEAELTANQRCWADLHSQQAASSAATGGHTGAASSSNGVVAAAEAAAHARFTPSTTFTGARPGYVFKRGVLGQGYYPDSQLQDGAGSQGSHPLPESSSPADSAGSSVSSAAQTALAALAAAGIPGPMPGGDAGAAGRSQHQQPPAPRLKPRITRSPAEDLD